MGVIDKQSKSCTKCGVVKQLGEFSMSSRGYHRRQSWCKACYKARTQSYGRELLPGYMCWREMNSRCRNPKSKSWASYGGRGITVHPDWHGRGGYERFIAHIGPRPTPRHQIDRIAILGTKGTMKTNQVQEFIDQFGEDAFEELYEACRERKGTDRVAILESIMQDAINWTHHGTFTTDEADVVFELQDGNWNGTELFYGEDYEFTRPVEYRFALKPAKELTPEMQSVYDLWKRQAWFTELEGKANYDLKFSPTTAIRQHYDAIAAKRGLRFVPEPVA